MSDIFEPKTDEDRETAVRAAMEYTSEWFDKAKKLQEDLEWALDQVQVGTTLVKEFAGPPDPNAALIIDGGGSDSEESAEI